ncbi:MAG: ZIP family metal transporter [bacterium]
MHILIYILITTFLISLGALVGIFTLALCEEKLSKILLALVSLSAGALIGGAFLHLLPEAAERFGGESLFIMVLIAFVVFFLIEKIFHWRHCHKGKCQIHTFGYMNLFGDAVHNFIDGLIIAATFMVDIRLGVVTAVAIALHEIPQEIGDFGVLLYAGFEKKKALWANFLVALTAILGGVIGYFASSHLENFIPYLLPFAAGGFIYIAASDLMPEIRKEESLKKSIVSFVVFVIGIAIMFLVKMIAH